MTDLECLLRDHGHAPEHAPDFEARLWTAIAAGAAATVTSLETVPAVRQRRRRRSLYGVLLAAALAAGALVLGVSLSRHAVHELRYPEPASAAEVAANVRSALSSIHTLRATELGYFKIVKGPLKSQWQKGWTTADWWARARIYSDEEFKSSGIENGSPYFGPDQIVATADGRWRSDSPEDSSDDRPVMIDQSSGDEAAGIIKVYWPGMALHVISDTSLGAPDDGGVGTGGLGYIEPPLRFVRPATLAAMARGQMSETTYDGRPALTISCPIAPRPIAKLDMDSHDFDTVAFTVDRGTWLIVRTTYLLRGQVIWQASLSNVRVNEPVTEAQVEPSVPPRTTTRESNQGFRRVSFAAAARAFSTRPLEPHALPHEFRPFAAAVASRAEFLYLNSRGGSQVHYWPPSRDVTQLSFRAGLLRFVVTTRAQPAGGPVPADRLIADPFVHDFESAEDDVAYTGSLQQVQLTGGAWRGVTAYLVTPLLESPHLWAWHDGVLVTVGGDLTRDQLLAVANSLEPME